MDREIPTPGNTDSLTQKKAEQLQYLIDRLKEQVTSDKLGHAKSEQLGFRVCIRRDSSKSERRQKLTGWWGS